ncbi:MAG: hypothetical protein ABFS16_03955 [Bacteroidota bacterium]
MKRKYISPLILIIITIVLTGCFGTRSITLDDKAISKKENVIVYQSGLSYELRNFSFNENDLSGDLWKSSLYLPKSKKLKWLEIYVESGFNLLAPGATSNYIKIPYASIQKIEKTRFRGEYGLLIIPTWLVGGVLIYWLSALFH